MFAKTITGVAGKTQKTRRLLCCESAAETGNCQTQRGNLHLSVSLSVCLCVLARVHSLLCLQQRHVMSERSVLLKGLQHPFLVGLHFSFQTPNMLYFVLDYVNGGEVCVDKKFLKRHSYVMLFCLTLSCLLFCSFFTIFRGRGHFLNSDQPSMLQRWPWH